MFQKFIQISPLGKNFAAGMQKTFFLFVTRATTLRLKEVKRSFDDDILTTSCESEEKEKIAFNQCLFYRSSQCRKIIDVHV